MAGDRSPRKPRRIEGLEGSALTTQLRQAADLLRPHRVVDDLELRHLTRVVTECSLLLTDVYSKERIARIMHPDRGLLSSLVLKLIEEEREAGGEVLYRVRRLPEDVRVVGDKALFDLGLLGLKTVKGYDLEDLGCRAYRAAGETLALLAEDRRLKEFFKQNRLLMLPLEEEVTFLKRCSENVSVYAGILRGLQSVVEPAGARRAEALEVRVPLMSAAAEALVAAEPGEVDLVVLEAARRDADAEAGLSREETLSAYERMVLFASLDLDRLRAALESVVVDQDEAVNALADELGLFASGTRDLRKPAAYFLVGPTGVGKNHLVESLCRLLEGPWGVEVPLLTIEGPSYTYPSDINELRGATRGFIRSDEEGLLSAFHERASRAPLSVILVDEVEKAHPQLRTFFLSILDRGTTTDNRGRVLRFPGTMIFFTSNLGYSDALQRAGPIGYLDEPARVEALDADVHRDLRRALSPEFMNRLRILHFRRLGRPSALRILDLELERIARRYREVHGLELELTSEAREEVLRRGFSPEYGARRLAAVLDAVLNVEVSRRIRRDDRREAGDREALVRHLRDLRSDGRAYDPAELRRRVLRLVRARLDYDAVRIHFSGDRFEYSPVRRQPGA